MSADPTNNNDPLSFVKNMWGNMGFSLPGMVTPTLDVNELDKRITDLKAVEGWLKMNLTMLQTSIQGLEMQRMSISTFNAMASGMSQMATSAAQPASPEAGSDAGAEAAPK
jgi:hypothetical protein